ncbi:MAG: hypothetical protein V1802_00225 [Candidatus Aenigmatarchaeota archaeon]
MKKALLILSGLVLASPKADAGYLRVSIGGPVVPYYYSMRGPSPYYRALWGMDQPVCIGSYVRMVSDRERCICSREAPLSQAEIEHIKEIAYMAGRKDALQEAEIKQLREENARLKNQQTPKTTVKEKCQHK